MPRMMDRRARGQKSIISTIPHCGNAPIECRSKGDNNRATESPAPEHPLKYHIVATEGATIDGRHISGEQLEQMAKNYDPAKYGARIWLEHIRGLYADSAFPALGDVTALKTEKNKDGKTVLLAAINPTPELVKINQAGQKVYTSIEINPRFADTGEAYLVGLAVTDSPASTGTSRLSFSAIQKEPEHLFSDYVQADLSDEEKPSPGIMDKIRAIFSKQENAEKDNGKRFAGIEEAITTVANEYSAGKQALQGEIDTLKNQLSGLQKQFTELKQAMDTTPANPPEPAQLFAAPRPIANGTTDIQTDC
ncbi:phage capsid scaffolding protein GpO [Cardiobacterium hominis ATCC 15826]|uniref:Phage capsid scaffolding protein GpO n=1 Tax=Cardiobacterium hominis (strain ATCC 15826 / DSM 8339 / NCTC 10426 / 6573) TaxID=638300 RepID=C8N782_CARH6|nr:phage capsid scaffolding protein GpO [Cardiobacterium hominis ATCC 15826]